MSWAIEQTIDLNNGKDAGEARQAIRPLAFPGNDNGHEWRVTVMRDAQAVDLAGTTVRAYFLRSDGTTVLVNGTKAGNVAKVQFDDTVYAIPGIVKAAMHVSLANTYDMTVASITFEVKENMTGSIIDPGSIVPNIQNILDKFDDMDAAVDDAETATAAANAAAAECLTYAENTFRSPWVPTSTQTTLISGGVDPETGKNTTGSAYVRTGFIMRSRPVLFTLDSADYKYTLYEYDTNSQADDHPYRSDTDEGYVTGSTFIPFDGTGTHFRIAFTRVSGSSDAPDTSAIAAAMKFYIMTDASLTLQNVPADAKATGDALAGKEAILTQKLEGSTDANTLIDNGYYYWASADRPDHTPFNSGAGMLLHYRANDSICYQMCWGYSSEDQWTRVKKGSTSAWSDWLRIGHMREINTARFLTKTLNSGDANAVTENGWYYWANATPPSNIPFSSAGHLINHIAASGDATSPNYQTVIRYTDGAAWTRVCKGSAYTAWERVASGDVAARRCWVKRTADSGGYDDGDASERLLIYIPAKSGYLEVTFYHYDKQVDSAYKDNCHNWQIYQINHVHDLSRTGVTGLSLPGEWECALHLDGRDDFSGGHTHGDEVMTSDGLTILVDGVATSANSLSTLTEFKELRLIQASYMYDPSDHTTKICDHGKEWVFSADGFTINQSVKWAGSFAATNCYMAMALPLKSITNRAYVNTEQKIITLAETDVPFDSIVKHNANEATIYGPHFSLTVKALQYPTGLTGGDQISFADNHTSERTPNYNKTYFRITNDTAVTSSTLWTSKVEYKLRYA